MRHRNELAPARFGCELGLGPGDVPVYSSDYDSADKAELPNREAYRSYVDGVFMGYKWQCVELARRWLYLNKGYVFDDIAMAYDIFQLTSVTCVKDMSQLPLKSFRNGSRRRPEPGALLIWNEGGTFKTTGHVAVVTEVRADRVRCIEQNVEDTVWPDGIDYSRELKARMDADGGYHIECTYDDASVLGWMIQTDDETHAEAIAKPDARLFNLLLRAVPDRGQAGTPWLNTANLDEAAYVAMMGGHKLTSNDADQYKYVCMSETAQREIKRATNELHAMFMHATNFVLQDDTLLRRFNFPPALWPRIHQSWDNRRNEMITGRFDFSVSERGVKVYEYNCDSASCHLECGVVQDRWSAHFGCAAGSSAGDELTQDLIEAWRDIGLDSTLHIMQDRDLEETYHALYMKAAAEKAGIRCKIIKGVAGLGWDDDAFVVDADGERINFVWKTWAWETALDQIRSEIDEDEATRLLPPREDRVKRPPRLVDVLLRRDVMVFEPLWTLVPSNKAILPILAMLYPNHRYLLDTKYELTDALRATGYASKPIVGRSGANIRLVDEHRALVEETAGRFDTQEQIYQQYFPLPNVDGYNLQVGTFSVAGALGGTCIRSDTSAVITTNSDLLALRILPDEDFLALVEP